jgi:DNA repair exonuclease SbcCD ATPase subunit|tara:strand:- start:4748 stop:6547 length:1800 start_codon:yes stop_codon:yes gene_type:complete
MITLRKLKWNNCFSYGSNNELDLDSNTVTQIIGKNGTGKSSIPLIIEEVLYNKNSKGIKKADIPNRYINEGYDIHLTFTKEDNLYEVIVIRKANIKVKLLKDGEDISSHTATNTYKTLQDVLGIDFKTFSQLVYQNTNSSLQFLTATDTNRKKFLIDLLHLEEYVVLFEIFKEASREANAKITEINAIIATIEKWLRDNKLASTTILPMLNLEIDTDEDEESLRSLLLEFENISEKNKTIRKNNSYQELFKQININEAHALKASKILSYDTLQTEEGSFKASIAGSNKLLEKMKKLGDSCPTCEQTVDSQFKDNLIQAELDNIERSSEKRGNASREIKRIKANNIEYNTKVSIQKDWEDLYSRINHSLPSLQVDGDKLSLRIEDLRTRIQKAQGKLELIAKGNEKRTRDNTRIQIILEQTESFKAELKASTTELSKHDRVFINLEILKKAFSTNGLLAYKIENLVKELEELVNTYLAEFSDGRFTLEFVVSNDKLNVQITDNSKIVDILVLSSGELARVNTATLIAIRKLMSSISKSRINVLFLDEVVSVLDDLGREKMVEILTQEENLNTYVVSHGWTHPLLNKIEIVKDQNTSRLEQ